MPYNGFEEFREIVLDDESLQKQLRDLMDMDEFISRVVELGRSHGFSFTAYDVGDAVRASQRSWVEG